MLMKRNYIRIFPLLIFCSLFYLSCDKESYNGIIIVHHEYSIGIDPVSLMERKSLQIKEIGSQEDYWKTIDYIEGFEYEEGYEYFLEVEVIKHKKPQIDMSDTTYKLIEILSKSKKSICKQ